MARTRARMFEDQLVPEISSSQIVLPTNWEHQCQCVKTYSLLPVSEEWKTCEKMILKSIQVTVTQVTRVQNMWLWEAYNFNKMRMNKRNFGIVNEMYLFHGTRCNSPLEIACGEDGFDVRLSNGGSWGHAIYLSDSALYVDKFAHSTPTGEKEIILAKALIGEAFDCGIEKNTGLRVPPIKQKSMQNMVNIKYDSIAGITKNTRVYMLYENYKTYPEYIVQYKLESPSNSVHE